MPKGEELESRKNQQTDFQYREHSITGKDKPYFFATWPLCFVISAVNRWFSHWNSCFEAGVRVVVKVALVLRVCLEKSPHATEVFMISFEFSKCHVSDVDVRLLLVQPNVCRWFVENSQRVRTELSWLSIPTYCITLLWENHQKCQFCINHHAFITASTPLRMTVSLKTLVQFAKPHWLQMDCHEIVCRHLWSPEDEP